MVWSLPVPVSVQLLLLLLLRAHSSAARRRWRLARIRAPLLLLLLDRPQVADSEMLFKPESDQMSPVELKSSSLDLTDTGKGLKLQTAMPHLVSLGSGRLSIAITLLPLNEGVTRIGRDDAPVPQDISIQGPGIEAEHCLIFNEGGVVTLDPCGHLCSLDGVQVTVPTPLTQGYSLCLGKSYFFRFNHPEEASRMKSMLPPKSPVSPLTYSTVPPPSPWRYSWILLRCGDVLDGASEVCQVYMGRSSP
ncbi:unnamed protein product [Merluccius merluccius]